MEIILILIIVIFSAIIHEVSHGVVAEELGDTTARDAGRLTLNPLPHIDLYGSIIMPLTLFLLHSPFLLAMAKPVPVRQERLRNPRWGMALVGLAGPLSNLLIALLLVAAIYLKLVTAGSIAYTIVTDAIFINLGLGIFNLIPIPPLDGSKVLGAFLPRRFRELVLDYERYGFIVIFILLILGGGTIVSWLVSITFALLLGGK